MSQQIIVLDEAEDELVAAERWYEHRRPGLGSEFRVAIDEAMAQLNAAPSPRHLFRLFHHRWALDKSLSNDFLLR